MNETDTLISSYLSSQLFFKNEIKDILSSVHGVDAGNIYSTYGNTIRSLPGNLVLNNDARKALEYASNPFHAIYKEDSSGETHTFSWTATPYRNGFPGGQQADFNNSYFLETGYTADDYLNKTAMLIHVGMRISSGELYYSFYKKRSSVASLRVTFADGVFIYSRNGRNVTIYEKESGRVFASKEYLSTVTDLSVSNMDKFVFWFCDDIVSNKDAYMTNLSATWIDGELQ